MFNGTKLLIAAHYTHLLRHIEFIRPITYSRCLLNDRQVQVTQSFSSKTIKNDTRQNHQKLKSLKLSSSNSEEFDLDAFLDKRENRTRSNDQSSKLERLFQLNKSGFHQPTNDRNNSQPEIKRNLYEPSESAINRSHEQIDEFRRTHNVKTSPDAPAPIFSLDELHNLPPNLIEELHRNNIRECTPIQAEGIPIALSGINLIGQAQTG